MSATGSSLKTTSLHGAHIAAGAKLTDFSGWEMPLQYESSRAEHEAVRNHAGMFDVSHMGRIAVCGPGAAAALQNLLTNDISQLAIGDSQYTLICAPDGGVIDDLLVYRLDDERYLLIVNASNHDADLAWTVEQCEPYNAEVDDVSDQFAMIAVQGPDARGILEQLAGAEMPSRSKVAEITIDGSDCIVCATGYTGEAGAELLIPAADARALWDKLLEAGVVPCGLAARDTLRLEACLPLYGHEFDRDRDPMGAGLGQFVAFDTVFIGREPLLKISEDGPEQTLVAFGIEGSGIPRQGNEIVEGGVVTSGTMSPTIGIGIGLGYVDSKLAKTGTTLTIDVRGRERSALIVKPPFHKLEEPRLVRD